MSAEAVNRLTRKNQFHLQLFRLVSFTAKNRETKKKWFNKHSLDIFLNSLFNTRSALAEHLSDHLDKYIGYSEVGSNQVSTPGLVFLHGIFFVRFSYVSFWFRFFPKTTSPYAFAKLIFGQMQINIYWCRQYTNLFF